jgi:hypothetical protein
MTSTGSTRTGFYLDGEHSFELTVNLYAGMGTVKGDYIREDGGSVAFEIKNKSFNGFAGDDATGFRAREALDGSLVYSGGAIGMLAENTVFYPMDGGPQQVTARPEDLPAQTVYLDEKQLEEQKELEEMQSVREQAAELSRSIGEQTNGQGERLYTITYVVVSASGDNTDRRANVYRGRAAHVRAGGEQPFAVPVRGYFGGRGDAQPRGRQSRRLSGRGSAPQNMPASFWMRALTARCMKRPY